MMAHLSGTTVIFDYDCTLVPEQSLEEILRIALASSRNPEARLEALRQRAARLNSGSARLSDRLALLAGLMRVRTEHVDHYVDAAIRRMGRFAPLFHTLRRDGATLLIASAGFIEWIAPVARAHGFSEAQVSANRLLWLGGRAVGLGKSPLLSAHGKADLVRSWRDQGRIAGPTIVVGDGEADHRIYLAGLADGFVAARYFVPGPTLSGDFVRTCFDPEAVGPAIGELVAQIRAFRQSD